MDIDRALETVYVEQLDKTTLEDVQPNLLNWSGIVTEADGGYIAYFADEKMAFLFRLFLINMTLNGDAVAQYAEYGKAE